MRYIIRLVLWNEERAVKTTLSPEATRERYILLFMLHSHPKVPWLVQPSVYYLSDNLDLLLNPRGCCIGSMVMSDSSHDS
jgi:hypothetical protein